MSTARRARGPARHDAHVRLYLRLASDIERHDHKAHVQQYRWRLGNIARKRAERTARRGGREPRPWAHVPAEMKAIPRHVRERDKRNEHKRRVRASKAAKPRGLHDGHVKRWLKWISRAAPKHDAHVRLYRSPIIRARIKTATDAAYRINQRLRVQIRKALKGDKRGRSWESIVGYTLAELAAHFMRMLPNDVTLRAALERGWHIDHIVAKSTFDLADPAELRAAWALPNLRLIPAHVNLRKGARMEHLL